MSVFQGFSSAAVAAVKTSPSGGSGAAPSIRGGGSSSNKFKAPWPWVDPGRPQILPSSIEKKLKQPVPLLDAITQLLVRRPGGEGKT